MKKFPNDLRLVIFDVDGTLRKMKSGEKRAPLSNDEWEIMPGVKEAIDKKLRHLAVFFGIVSNQACIDRGEIDYNTALEMIYDLEKELTLNAHQDAIKVCRHLPDSCVCRKPSPMMLYDIMRFWRVTAKQTIFIGDAKTDEQAAENCGCHFMYINEFLEKE